MFNSIILKTCIRTWEATTQIISSQMKYTRDGGVFYVAILADQSVRTLLKKVLYYFRNQYCVDGQI
jgi:hypothetical protein